MKKDDHLPLFSSWGFMKIFMRDFFYFGVFWWLIAAFCFAITCVVNYLHRIEGRAEEPLWFCVLLMVVFGVLVAAILTLAWGLRPDHPFFFLEKDDAVSIRARRESLRNQHQQNHNYYLRSRRQV